MPLININTILGKADLATVTDVCRIYKIDPQGRTPKGEIADSL